jgi:hypothetical protein
MFRTTVYLPPQLMDRTRLAARARGVTAAAVIRSALESSIGDHRPTPTGGFLTRDGQTL